VNVAQAGQRVPFAEAVAGQLSDPQSPSEVADGLLIAA
jgi:hypothetical protein